MEERLKRTAKLLGEEAIEKLKNSHVAIFGIGGVGGYVLEALCRSGVGTISIVDNDLVSESNINRQIIATYDTIGEEKVDVAEKRAKSINPDINIIKHNIFYLPDEESDIDFACFDYIVDAIDTVSGKIGLIMEAKSLNIPVISAMGAGNKLDPTQFKVSDIYKTKVCPLSKVMRYELKKRGVKNLKVVYSEEEPIKVFDEDEKSRKKAPGSVAFVPSVAGLIIAGEVIKDLTEK